MKKFVIGIDLGSTKIKGALVSETGKFIHYRDELTPATKGRDAVIDKICSVVDYLISKNKDVCGIGIGIPGIVDQETGTVIGASPNLVDWVGTPVRNILQNRYKFPVEVDNDVNTVTLGEYDFGNIKPVKDVACVVIGTGIGIGIIQNEELFRNAHELGHMNVKFGGLSCGCGRQGCVEAFCSGKGMVNNYHISAGEKSPFSKKDITPQKIFTEFQNGHSNAKKVVSDFIYALSSAMANIILAFSITDLIIAGGISRSFSVFHDRLLTEVHKCSISHLNNQISIKQGTLGDQAGILGAASLIFRQRH